MKDRIIKFPEAKWFEVKNQTADGKSADIYLYDEISPYLPGSNAKDVVMQLKALSEVETLNVRINSPGGSVFEGMAIYNALSRHPGVVNVYIDGLAASIAGVIAMAGKKIYMADNAMWMTHMPSAVAFGTAKEMRQTADVLDQLKETIINVFAARTGKKRETISNWMEAETWMQADEAKKNKIIDEVIGSVKAVAFADMKDFGYMNVPKLSAKTAETAPVIPPVVAPIALVVESPVVVMEPIVNKQSEENSQALRLRKLEQLLTEINS